MAKALSVLSLTLDNRGRKVLETAIFLFFLNLNAMFIYSRLLKQSLLIPLLGYGK